MFEQIVPKLLEGEFICESTAPSLFRALADEAFRAEVDAFLGKIKRRLTITPNGQAYYASWVRVGKEQRAEAKRVMVSIKQTIRPVIQFIELCMDSLKTDAAPAPGDRIDYPAILKSVTENPHLQEKLREFATLGKEFAANESSSNAMLGKVFQQLEKSGYIVFAYPEQEAWRFTGKLDYYYEIITFLMENEGIQQQRDEKDDDPETGRLF
ncbi:MAG TPA: hypothetical protein PLI90_05525 [Rhodocyclaceae bacterium]|mgnify:CR=1 FL=1|jgi:hypothetical protein|nr:hypothetical protein [Rhodocyclaceae bacterium]